MCMFEQQLLDELIVQDLRIERSDSNNRHRHLLMTELENQISLLNKGLRRAAASSCSSSAALLLPVALLFLWRSLRSCRIQNVRDRHQHDLDDPSYFVNQLEKQNPSSISVFELAVAIRDNNGGILHSNTVAQANIININNNNNNSNNDQLSLDLIQKITVSMFHEQTQTQNSRRHHSPLFDFSQTNQSEASTLLSWILKNLPFLNGLSTPAQRQQQMQLLTHFKTQCLLFVVFPANAPSLFQDLAFDDVVKPLWHANTTLDLLAARKVIFAGSCQRVLQNVQQQGNDQKEVTDVQIICENLRRFKQEQEQAGELLNDCNIKYDKCSISLASACNQVTSSWIESILGENHIESEDHVGVTFGDFVHNILATVFPASSSKSRGGDFSSPFALLPVVSLFAVWSTRPLSSIAFSLDVLKRVITDDSSGNIGSCARRRINDEFASCFIFFNVAAYCFFSSSSSEEEEDEEREEDEDGGGETAEGRRSCVENIVDILRSAHNDSTKLVLVASLVRSAFFAPSLTSAESLTGAFIKNLFGDVSAVWNSSSCSTSKNESVHRDSNNIINVTEFFDLVNEVLFDDEPEARDEESGEDTLPPCYSLLLQSVIAAICYSCLASNQNNDSNDKNDNDGSVISISVRTKIYGLTLKQLATARSNYPQVSHLQSSALRIFTSHIMQSGNSACSVDQNTSEHQQQRQLAGFCVMLILEGILEPWFDANGNSSISLSNNDELVDRFLSPPRSSESLHHHFPSTAACRLFVKYLKQYLSRTNHENGENVLSLDDGLTALLFSSSSSSSCQRFNWFVTDLVRRVCNNSNDDDDDDDDDDSNEIDLRQRSQNLLLISGSSAASVVVRKILGLDSSDLIIARDRGDDSSIELTSPTTSVPSISLSTRVALVGLQKQESQVRTKLERCLLHFDDSNAPSNRDLLLGFWTSGAMQLHIEYLRERLLPEYHDNVVARAIESLWLHQLCEMKLVTVDLKLVEDDENFERRIEIEKFETEVAAAILFPLVAATRSLLLLEAAARAPLGLRASSYASLSWLFEEEKVVRNEIIIADEHEERHGPLAAAFERLVFACDAETRLRNERHQWLHMHKSILVSVCRSVFDEVHTAEHRRREFIEKSFELQVRQQQQWRQDLEHEFLDIFLHDLLVVKRRQEKFWNEVFTQHVASFRECCQDLHHSWAAVVEAEWEEGLDKIYQLREEEGGSIICDGSTVETNLQESQVEHDGEVSLRKSCPSQQLPSTTRNAVDSVAENKKKHLPFHIAKSIYESEASIRRAIRGEQVVEQEKILFVMWRTVWNHK